MNRRCGPGLAVFAAIALLAGLIYAQTAGFEFTNFDDPIYVYENELVQNGLTWGGVADAFRFGSETYWHPLTWLSHMADVSLFGLNPGMHHLSNVFLHIVNAFLVFITLYTLTGAFYRSAAVALLFTVHPVNVDTVAWVAERKNLLSTTFWFFTMLAYIGYARNGRKGCYVLTLLMFTLGTLTKPMLVTMPFVLLMADVWPLQRLSGPLSAEPVTGKVGVSRAIMEKLPFLLLAVGAIIVSSVSLDRIDNIIPFSVIPLSLRLENAVVSYVQYLSNAVLPVRLSVYYPFPYAIAPWKTVSAAVFLAAVSVFCLMNVRSRPWRPFGWFWFIGTLVPVSGIIQGGLWPALADRWAYIPFIGLFIWGVWEAAAWMDTATRRRWGWAAAAGVGAALTVLSYQQTTHWQNTYTLFSHALAVTEGNYVSHLKMARQLMDRGRLEEALTHYRAAIAMSEQAEPLYESANVLKRLGRPEAALPLYQRAVDIAPDLSKARVLLANHYRDIGNTAAAIEQYRAAIGLAPADAGPLSSLGVLYMKHGDAPQAIPYLKRAHELAPESPETAYNLARALLDTGSYAPAIETYRRALSIGAAPLDCHLNMGTAYIALGRLDDAIEQFRAAVEIAPDSKAAQMNLERAMADKSAFDERVTSTRVRLSTAPTDPSALTDLGDAFDRIHDRHRAKTYYEKAIAASPGYTPALGRLAILCARQNDLDCAETHFLEIMKRHPASDITSYNLACIYSRKGQISSALHWLKRAVHLGYDKWSLIMTDEDLSALRESPDFKEVLALRPASW